MDNVTKKLLEDIKKTLSYYSFFSYAPTTTQLHRALGRKISIQDIEKHLAIATKNKIISVAKGRVGLKPKDIKKTLASQNEAKELFNKVYPLLKVFSIFPTVSYLGISGSMSMDQVGSASDVDIFIIVNGRTIWTTRLAILLLKKFFRMIPFLHAKKLCFNLFFAHDSLKIRKKKQNLYVGYEIIQLKTFCDKGDNYLRFLKANDWLVKFFPNVHIVSGQDKLTIRQFKHSRLTDTIEGISKKIQVWWLAKTGYRYKDYGGQLWLIQEDWEEKVNAERAGFEPAWKSFELPGV